LFFYFLQKPFLFVWHCSFSLFFFIYLQIFCLIFVVLFFQILPIFSILIKFAWQWKSSKLLLLSFCKYFSSSFSSYYSSSTSLSFILCYFFSSLSLQLHILSQSSPWTTHDAIIYYKVVLTIFLTKLTRVLSWTLL